MWQHKIFGLRTKECRALGLGVFDGLHLGHQALAKKCSHLLTFWPHPDVFLAKYKKLKMLTTLREMRFFSPKLVVVRFDEDIAKLSAKDFLEEIIYKEINPKKIVVGYDFHFGYKKQGDIALLSEWAKEKKIIVEQIPAVTYEQEIVKSSKIRELLKNDAFDKARKLLGHSYLLIGKVIKGDGRGKMLGFPTANIKVPSRKLVPENGVYKGWVKINNVKYKALINIGFKPTFGTKKKSIEVYINDFDDDIYGKNLKVFLDEKVRSEIKFNNSEELKNQIDKDVRNYL